MGCLPTLLQSTGLQARHTMLERGGGCTQLQSTGMHARHTMLESGGAVIEFEQ